MDFESDNPSDWISGLFPFTLLSGNALRVIAPMIEVIECPPGLRLYNNGDIPDYFYWVLSGEVNITTAAIRRGKREQNLSPGDSFGVEVLSRTDYRFSRVTCKSQARFARINEQDLLSIQNQFPVLKKAFSLIYQTQKHRIRVFLPWQESDEKVNLLCRKHIFFLLLRVLIIGGVSVGLFAALLSFAVSGKSVGLLLLALVSLLLGLFITGWSALEWGNDYFILSSDRVLVQKKLTGFFDSRQEAPFSAILSSGLESSFWGRLLDFGTINLKTYNGNMSFSGLPNPMIIFNLLEYQRLHKVHESQHNEQSEIRATLKQRLDGKPAPSAVHHSGSSRAGMKAAYTSGSLLDTAARFFGLRLESEDSVIFRTHWWRLVSRTLLPTLLMLVVIGLVVIDSLGYMPGVPDKLLYSIAIIATLASWGWWLYRYQDWYNDVYIITPDQLIDINRKPLSKEERHAAPIQNVQTVEFKRKGLLGLILNFGTVRIQIGNQELTFDDVYDPAAIQAEIFSRFKNNKQKAAQLEQGKLADWITTYDEIRKENRNQEENAGFYR